MLPLSRRIQCHFTGTGMSRSSPKVGKLALIWGHFRSKPRSSTGPVSDFKDAGILLTSTVGKAIEGVPFVASACECARVVDAAVVTGPIQRAFIHICNFKGRGHLKPTLRDAWREHIYNNTSYWGKQHKPNKTLPMSSPTHLCFF